MTKIKKRERVVKPNRRARTALTNARVAEALKISGGHVSDAAKLCGRSQGRISQMISKSSELQQVRSAEIEELYQLAKDGLKFRVKKRDTTACIYVTKCLGKAEGFIEKSEIGIDAKFRAEGTFGVLLLPAPSHDLNSWEALASEWDRKQITYDGDVDIDEDE